MESSKKSRTGDGAVEVGILFQSQYLGPVIGKGGENINKIREESGAVVTTSKFNKDTPERTAKIVGSVEQVSTAIKMIIDIVCKDNPMITLLGEYKNCGNLIGKQGATIKQIREESGANIRVSKDCIGNSTQKEITVNGDYDAVTTAIDAVVEYLAQGNNPTRIAYVPGGIGGFPNLVSGFPNINSAGRGWVMPPAGPGALPFMQNIGGGGAGSSLIRMEMTLWVPKEVIGKVIGRGGNTIRTVREQSSAHVFVHKSDEDEDSSERKITIKGNRKSINMACSMLETLVMG